jgi:hypothetical protein
MLFTAGVSFGFMRRGFGARVGILEGIMIWWFRKETLFLYFFELAFNAHTTNNMAFWGWIWLFSRRWASE